MTDILDIIIDNKDLHLLGKEPLTPPYTFDENRIVEHLATLDESAAFTLKDAVQMAVLERQWEGIRSGIRVGVRLAAELTIPEEE